MPLVSTGLLASIVTALTEVAFAEFSGRDDLLHSIAERFAAVEELLECYVGSRPVDSKTEKHITRCGLSFSGSESKGLGVAFR